MAKNSEEFNRNFKVRVDFEQPPERELRLIGFLFLCNGRLLQWQFVKDNILEFNLEKTNSENQRRKINPEQLRLFIAPASDTKMTRISMPEQLQNYKAYEAVIRLDEKQGYQILPIPEALSRYWLLCKCRVNGKVSKWFHKGEGWTDRPVCKARVHICEIDSIFYWINKIPDHIIARVPEAVLKPKFQIPVPIPDPGPYQLMQPFPITGGANEENIFKTESRAAVQLKTLSRLPELGADIKQQLASGNLNTIRETIAKNYALLHPWFCFWPWWWPYFYRCKELTVVETNANGRFEKNIYYNCFGDKPDIYIWVEYMINGVWTTVYKPPIPCNTHWNYVCGTDINIHLTHEMVAGDCCCDCHLPGQNVWLRSVGYTSVSHIKQMHQLLPPPGQSVVYDRVGLTDAGAAGDSFLITSAEDYKRPFGGTPTFRMGFGNDLPNSNMYYYRWSYRKLSLTDSSPITAYEPVAPVGASFYKGYDYIYTDSSGDEQWGADSVKLGPFTKGPNDDLYIIPPELPEMDPFNVPTDSHPHWHQQTYNMNTMTFDSTALDGDGLYQFKLELFDKAGNLLQDLPRATFKTPRHDDASFSENAPDILLENPNSSNADAFNVIMRIDNGECEGDIYTVNVNGNPAASNCCGFVKYTAEGEEAELELTFKAVHPTNFAEFSFGVVKGTCGGISIASARGMVIDSAYGYTLNTGTGIYSKTFTPADLLGECYEDGAGKAAFAETLHIISTATDGISRVAKDYGRTVAFALEP